MDEALHEIAKLRTLCRLVDPTDLNAFLAKLNRVDPYAIRENPNHDFKIIKSNISSGYIIMIVSEVIVCPNICIYSSVPNPILPNNRTADLMPAVYANDIQDNINSFIMRPVTPADGRNISRPTTPLKPCIKAHARAHSAARRKRVSILDKNTVSQGTDDTSSQHNNASIAHDGHAIAHGGPRVIRHTGSAENEWAATEPVPRPVHHNDAPAKGSMFSMTSSNPDYEPDPNKQSHHYTPFEPPPKKIADTIRLKLDNRVFSLQQAFQELDTTNCGYITQNELLNACWYWGIRIGPKDLAMLVNEYYSVIWRRYEFYIPSIV